MRVRTILLICLAAGSARAQPLDPYKQPPTPTPTPTSQPPAPAPRPTPTPQPPTPQPPTPAPVRSDDPVLAEQVAQSLVYRAQELYDARVFVDAKQLAVEALVRSPRGAAAEQARFLIKSINQELGITDEPVKKPEDKVDLTPIKDPVTPLPKVDSAPEQPARLNRITAGVHSALYVGLLGATVGAFFDEETPAGGAVPVGIAAGLAAGLYVPRMFDRLKWNDAQVRTMGAAGVWGGVIGGLFADSVKKEDTSARHVLVGASIGATLGGLGGAAIARKNQFTKGDVALVDTLAGIGAVGGLTLGMLMQPAETEAYSVNSIIGTIGGTIIGMVAAPQTNTTQRRMLRVAGVAALGGAVPFLLYAGIYDGDATGDERVTGLFSTAGLVVGAYIGFRMTRNMDRGLDVQPGKKIEKEDAPIGMINRHSDGRWSPGTVSLQPLSQQLAPQRGMSVPLLGVSW